jgi:hypothetical protein
MLHQVRLARIPKAIRKLGDDTGPLLHLAQKQTPAVAADGSPIKLASNFSLI